MMLDQNDYRNILKEALVRRCEKNPRYSLRAFARDLDLSSARLSEILNRKSGLSFEKAQHVAKALGFNAEEAEYFCDLVDSFHARSEMKRDLAKTRLMKLKSKRYRSMETTQFQIVSNWYHFAILELLELDGAKNDSKWVAKRLGIQEIEAKLALQRLVEFGFLELKRNRYVITHAFSTVSTIAPSEIIRAFHQQVLRKAIESVDLQSIEQRELGANIMSIDKKDLPKLKEMIRQFRKEVSALASSAERKNAVYCLSTPFFELTRMEKK